MFRQLDISINGLIFSAQIPSLHVYSVPLFEFLGPTKIKIEHIISPQGLFSNLSVLSRYDPRHNSWKTIQPLQQQHADHCVCVAGGHIYAIGGRDYSSELDCVERYDPKTNKWEFVSPLKREV